jgi:polar amino acid transport system permease protein
VLDVAIIVTVLAMLGVLVIRANAVLDHRWNWSVIPIYLVRTDPVTGTWAANLLLQGFFTTIRLAVWSLLIGTIVGTVAASMRVSGRPALRWLARGFVELVRNTPPIVLIFVGYFFVSSQLMPLFGIDAAVRAASPAALWTIEVGFGEPRLLQNFLSAVMVLALFEGAYVAEILRAGIGSVERGQWDAAAALGMGRWRSLRHVVLPQAVAKMVPPLCGQVISLIKDSSVVSLISIQELTFMASDVAVSTARVFETWITASAMYFFVCLLLSLAFRRLEARLAR